MSNNLASGVAVLSANADPFAKGLDQASKDLNKWGANTGRQITSFGSSFRTSFKDMFAGGLGIGAGGAIASFGLNSAKSFGSSFMDQLNDIGKQNDMAKALGMTTSQFSGVAGLAKSFGEDTKEFIESLVTMGKLGYDAANGIGEVAGPAFAALNLNAAQFIKLRPDEQFFKMFEALNKVGDGAQRTQLLMKAFGEDGGKLLIGLMSKAPDELRNLAKGFEISEEAAKKAAATNEAYKKFQQDLNVAFREFAVGAAPALTDGFKALNKVLTENKETLATVAEGFGVLALETVDRAKTWVEFADSFARTAEAMKEMSGSGFDFKSLMGSPVGQFASLFPETLPQTGREFGQSIIAAANEFNNKVIEPLAKLYDPRSLFGLRPPKDLPSTDSILDKANGANALRKPVPLKPPGEFWSKEIGEWAKEINDKMFAASRTAWQTSWLANADWSPVTRLVAEVGQSVKMLSSITEHWWTDPRKGAGLWAGLTGINQQMSGPKFADAVEQGSREAVQREMSAKYGNPWSGQSDKRDPVPELRIVNRKLDLMIRALKNLKLETI